MYSKFKESKLLFWTVELVLTIIGVFFIIQMPNVFSPVLKMISAIVLPLLIAGFFYYMFNPVVSFLEKHRIPRVYGYILVLVVVIVVTVLANHECDSSIGRTNDSINTKLTNLRRRNE